MQESQQRNSLFSVISEALARGGTILAPNERAAADLRARFDRAQSAAGLNAWEPAQIRSWNAWLESLWSTLVTQGAELRLLLNPPQEHTLWREIISASATAPSLGSPDSLAELAQTAWRLAASYEATADLRPFANTHDAKTFATWAAAFAKRCERGQFLSAAELPAAIREHIADGALKPPSNLLMVGFDDDTPARTSLLTALEEHGCTIDRLEIDTGITELRTIVTAGNPTEELSTAAHWIRHFIGTSSEPTRIALVVPNLDAERPVLEATLRNILTPELQSIDTDLSSTPYSFSTGGSLAETPMVATALNLIRWLTGPLPLDRVTTLLLSAYIGGFEDLEARATFDAFTLRRTPLLRPEIDIARLHRLASTSQPVGNLLAPLATRRPGDALRSYADWMEFVRDALRDANFPGDRPLTAQEFRDARTWDHVLDAVATLDFTGTRVDFRTSLEALARQARTASTSQGANDASVQIMTPAEAAGSSFDAIVFLRATDANWPTPTRANPLLGWALQNDRHMPGASLSDTAARAERATARLLAAAPNVLFFYAEEDESGAQRLSPTIADLNLPTITASELIPSLELEPTIPTEAFPDIDPLPPLPSGEVTGGARVLQQQAACGFLAFSEFRLRSRPLNNIPAGLDALESGNLLHRTMQAFWKAVGSQTALRNMEPAAREALLIRCIASAVDSRIVPETAWDNAYLQLQKDRLLILLRFWLNAELDRGPFSVLDMEVDTVVSVGPLTLSVRMDRIDRIEGVSNGFVYVDYKTGFSANPASWTGPRPDDPQLPLYALVSQPGELKGLAFAKVRAGKGMAWLGYQAEPGILPMKRPSTVELDDLIEEWRSTLTTLAEDFANGRATVSPKDFAVNCARCAQRLLCRVNPELLFITPDDEAGDDAE